MNATPRLRELVLDGLSRSYGTQVALAALDLEIAGGEFIALLGPSGCGKSTALNCIAGLIAPTSGTISLDGRPLDGTPSERRGFGVVFQSYALFEHMTVRANVAFGLRMRRLPKASVAERVQRALALVQLAGHADKYPTQLSGGQQQRVAIARAIVIEPPLVLMDEPLSNLDAKLRLDMRTEIRRLHRELGLTTIYVTHDQEEAFSLADRLVVLRDGVTQQIGTPDDVYYRPANPYVADFVGFRNAVAMELERRDGDAGVARGHGLSARGTVVGDATGGAVTLAIRPDDLVVGGPGDNAFEITVDAVEFRGRGFVVDGPTAAGQRLRGTSPAPVAVGETVTLRAPSARVLLFGEAA
ncbi:MAG TPA: ABC transporter ATP-binding protein [Solirubrobacteraceae bacterium]|nr:ABC transporter ATP-binding protein [Solirubrobacteraceae bacterium]